MTIRALLGKPHNPRLKTAWASPEALVDETLLSVLDQLHSGYPGHPEHAPHSLALIGRGDTGQVFTDGGDPLDKGLEQLGGYLDRLGLDTGTLVIFDQRSDAPPILERCSRGETDHHGRRITVLRL